MPLDKVHPSHACGDNFKLHSFLCSNFAYFPIVKYLKAIGDKSIPTQNYLKVAERQGKINVMQMTAPELASKKKTFFLL